MNDKAITCVCDICGGTINPHHVALGLTRNFAGKWEPDYSRTAEIHFCEECADNLTEAVEDHREYITGEGA